MRPLEAYPDSVLPPRARELITSMIQVDHAKRPTIDQVLAHDYFSQILESSQNQEEDQTLRGISDDLIKRSNVYRTSVSREELIRHIDQQSDKVISKERVEHLKTLALYFIFDADPDQDQVDQMKNQVQEEGSTKS